MKSYLILLLSILVYSASAQNFPWERPLKMAWSVDGTTFNTPSVFQDSSGVPSVIRWKGDTLICAFQWFRLPQNSPTWDKVAVKFSYDKGMTWTDPVPIVINGLPPNYQRPFDPTLATFGGDSIRMYYSSSDGIPMGLDSTVNTYSAASNDGIHFYFEPAARVDELNKRVIDPAVIYFNTGWHYTAPIGSPQQGAYHYVSPDGINFTKVPDIPSDNIHNWTGNLMISNDSVLRFYGASPTTIWYKSSVNGGVWGNYFNTNIHGGDPSVIQIESNNYLMVYVGDPYAPLLLGNTAQSNFEIYPNPFADKLLISSKTEEMRNATVQIFDFKGIMMHTFTLQDTLHSADLGSLSAGIYFVEIRHQTHILRTRVVKL
ncbi:MAG: T9SS type A sorting domain-containing protein [Chitinophagaceae bacterium]|nr:T9SS type A sorting domain-containing protein [Chitinophagaceae bacterium]